MEAPTDVTYIRFTELFQRHRKMLWSMCYSHARRDPERARDLLQEVAVALWHRYCLRPEGEIKMELMWVRWRAVLSHLARRRIEERLPEHYEIADSEARVLAEERAMVEELMACLTPVERETVQLHIDGYNYEEIAAMKGRTPTGVKQTAYRAMQKMKQYNETLI